MNQVLTRRLMAGCRNIPMAMLLLLSAGVSAQPADESRGALLAFPGAKEKSTLESSPFQPLEGQELARSVIEGTIAPPSAGGADDEEASAIRRKLSDLAEPKLVPEVITGNPANAGYVAPVLGHRAKVTTF